MRDIRLDDSNHFRTYHQVLATVRTGNRQRHAFVSGVINAVVVFTSEIGEPNLVTNHKLSVQSPIRFLIGKLPKAVLSFLIVG